MTAVAEPSHRETDRQTDRKAHEKTGHETSPKTRREKLNWARVATVARTDLKQLVQARDFWMPMTILGSFFFVVIPAVLLLTVTRIGDIQVVSQISQTLEVLPESAREQIRGTSPEGQTGYALAVFLFAPVAVIVPLTISTAVGSSTIVGERERGTGEFLAHSPASAKEIYLGKLIASLVPGYFTVVVGFSLYSLLVNLTVGPSVGGWFFPTRQWWIMILWVLPPFLAICLSLVLRLSARVNSTAAAQQASGLISLPLIMVAYSQATGILFGAGNLPLVVGAVAWVLALLSLNRGVRSVTRSRLLGTGDGG
jgi:ABC-type transport system involved in multi-copper enzyme maturation permease subunit